MPDHDYLWYKWYTNDAVSWLINTAKYHGSNVQYVEPAGQPPPPRLTGRARTLDRRAREAGVLPPPPPVAAMTARRVVTTNEIITQAMYLANSGDTFPIRRSQWQSFGRAIHGRQRHAARYEREERGNASGNAGHTFFIAILQQTVQLLSGCVRIQKGDGKNTDDKSAETALAFKNFFNLLEKNDPETLDAIYANGRDTEETLPDASSSTSTHHIYEPNIDPVEELRFRWACFLETLMTTKNYVGGKWLASSNERRCPLYLAFMTEAGITLIEKEHDDVMHVAEKFKELHLQFSADPATTFSRTLVSILDIKEVRKKNPGFLIPLPSLIVRRGQTEPIDLAWAQEETFLVQYLMEIGLECHIRKTIYETKMALKRGYKQPLSSMSFDQLSRVLQSIGDDNPQLATIALAVAFGRASQP